ncbi:MAG: DUF6769 family protein [Odoribacter sp.]
MLKRIAAISILSFASIVMLAFAVFPHHHHQEYICFSTSHCEGEAGSGHHSHDDQPASGDTGCVKHLFQTEISRIQSIEHSCAEGHCHHYTLYLFPTTDIFEFLSNSVDCKNTSLHPFYRERLHSASYFSDLSGRAPPAETIS